MKQLYTIIGLLVCNVLHAQWSTDPTINNQVITETTSVKSGLVSYTDTNDNTFIAWVDARNTATTGNDIYLQKLNSSGTPLLAATGLLVCNAANNQGTLGIISDGSDGVILTWLDNRLSTSSADIYAQRINGAGLPQWTANGLALINNTDNQLDPRAIQVNATDFYVVWRENRTGGTTGVDIFANKYTLTTGAKQLANDVEVVRQPNTQAQHRLLADGNGGLYCVWTDPRVATTTQDIYLQKLDNNGAISTGAGYTWALHGNVVEDLPASQNCLNPQLVTDGVGGVIVTWNDNRLATADIGVYAQKIDITGTKQWNSGSAVVVYDDASATSKQNEPRIVSDALGGAIICFTDTRNSATTGNDIYAQRLDASGVKLWNALAVPVCTSPFTQPFTSNITVISDKNNGAVIIWDDNRDFATPTNDYSIYAQRLLSTDGSPAWSVNGVPIATKLLSNQTLGGVTAKNTANEYAVVAFLDTRANATLTNTSIYASSVNSFGLLPTCFASIQAYKQGEHNKVLWTIGNCSTISTFVVERSSNSIAFDYLGTVHATFASNYSILDNAPVAANNYYRIKATLANGEVKYSSIVRVHNGKALYSYLYPNPVTHTAVLQVQTVANTQYTLTATDLAGKQVYYQSFKATTNAGTTQSINMSNWHTGMYTLKVQANGEQQVLQVVKQ